MNSLPMSIFNREVVTINRELKMLEAHSGPTTDYDLIVKWNTTKAKIFHLLPKLCSFARDMGIYEMVDSTLYELQKRVEQLPYVPDIRTVIRAQNLLALSPHIIATEDVQPDEKEPPELKRITIVNSDEIVFFDQDFLPQYAQDGSLPSWSAPTKHPSQATPSIPLTQIWDDLAKALSGHYLLTYDLALIQAQLDGTVKRFQLSTPVLIGESILDLYFAYLGGNLIPTSAGPEDAPAIF